MGFERFANQSYTGNTPKIYPIGRLMLPASVLEKAGLANETGCVLDFDRERRLIGINPTTGKDDGYVVRLSIDKDRLAGRRLHVYRLLRLMGLASYKGPVTVRDDSEGYSLLLEIPLLASFDAKSAPTNGTVTRNVPTNAPPKPTSPPVPAYRGPDADCVPWYHHVGLTNERFQALCFAILSGKREVEIIDEHGVTPRMYHKVYAVLNEDCNLVSSKALAPDEKRKLFESLLKKWDREAAPA